MYRTTIRHKFLLGLFMSMMSIGIAFGQHDIYLPVIAKATVLTAQETPKSDPVTEEERAIALVSAFEPFALLLVDYPDWAANAYRTDETANVWYVDFYEHEEGEWIGGGNINLNTEEIFDYYAPRNLTPEEFQAGQARIEPYLADDAEILARMGNPIHWDHNLEYNKWESHWEAYYWYGLDNFMVVINLSDENDLWIDGIVDSDVLDAEAEARHQRDQAIEVAWQADGIDAALDQVDNWHTYVELQGDTRYTVEFVTEDRRLFSAYVDIGTWRVLEAGVD